MSKAAVIPLFGRGFTSKSPTVTRQLLTNMYREPQQEPDKAPMILYQTPGLVMQVDFTVGLLPGMVANEGCRGARVVADTTWMVFGSNVHYQTTAGGGSVGQSLVLLTTTSGRVDISDNGSQLIIVDGVFGYTIALLPNGTPSGSADIVKIVSAGFPTNPTVVEFINGFFLVDAPNGLRPGQFNWSKLYDGTIWSSLDFANAESAPDKLVQIKVKAGQIYLLGSDSYEVWAPTGDTRFFARMGGTGAEWGIAAKWSIADYGDNTLVMLAKNKLGQYMPVKIVGYNVEPIGGNDPEIVNNMNQLPAAQATGYSYSLDGHSFYQVNYPSRSYLFDNLSNAWSVLISNGGRHFGEVRLDNAPLLTGPLNAVVFDYRKPSVSTTSGSFYTDYEFPIIRTIITKHLFSDYERISINELYVDCEVGTADVPGSAPTPISGHGVPVASVGNVGDYYIDLDTGILYGPKASGTVAVEHGAPGSLVSTGGSAALDANIGAWMTFAVAGTITHVRCGRSALTYDTSRHAYINDTTLATQLATGWVPNDGGGTKWVDVPLDVPLHVTAGQSVVPSWHTVGNIPTSTGTSWQQATVTFPISNGGSISISKGMRGLTPANMVDISPAYPFVDVLFVADSATPFWPVATSGLPLRAPQIMLEWSKDGGRTWGNQIFQSLGNIGQYQTRARWQNLGIARDWVFRLGFSDNNKLVITNAAVRVS